MLRADAERRAPARTSRGTWFDHAVLALALLLLLTGFRTIVEGSNWWVTAMLVAILTGLTCAVLRGLGFRVVAPFVVLVEIVALAWIFVPETLLSIVPTPSTFTALADLVSAARVIIVEEQAPVGAARPIVLVVAASFGLIVIVGDALLHTRRAAPLVGLLLLGVFAAPALISGETPSAWLFGAVAALWLVLLRSRTATAGLSTRGAGPATVLGTLALAAAVLFPVVAPDVSAVAASWGKPPSAVFGRGINPMLELGQNLRRGGTSVALTYTTSLDDAQYLKVATLRDFTGKTWRPTTNGRGDRMEGQLDVDSDIETEEARTTITIRQLKSPYLPVPYPALGYVSGLKGAWGFQRAGLTLTSRESDSRGQTYTVPSLDVQPTAEQMRGLTTDVGSAMDPYLELPATMPAVIERTARDVTSEADNDYDRVLALQKYFRDGDFRYSETAPVAGDYDGNGVDVIAKFLQVKAGYCVHFSSAMAVMARTLDIPSRIAVGYAPGSSASVDEGNTVYRNVSSDLHAWTEIYFQGVGWVRFDPTTSIGSATAFAEPAVDAPDATSPDSTDEPEAAPQPVPDQLDSGAVVTSDRTGTAPRSAIVTIGAILLIGAAPWILRSLRRRWRLRRGLHDVEPLWRELEDVARDLRIRSSAADTPRGFAARLAEQPGVDADSLDLLLRRVEKVRFSRAAPPDGDGVADLQRVVIALRGGATSRQRLLATVLPQSLAGRAPVTRVPDTGTLAK